jgi:hypothetical protein
MTRVCPGRTYFRILKGRIGIGAPNARTGDLVVVLWAANPVFILRKSLNEGPNEAMELVGDAFVHGLMDLNETKGEDIGHTKMFKIC